MILFFIFFLFLNFLFQLSYFLSHLRDINFSFCIFILFFCSEIRDSIGSFFFLSEVLKEFFFVKRICKDGFLPSNFFLSIRYSSSLLPRIYIRQGILKLIHEIRRLPPQIHRTLIQSLNHPPNNFLI